MRRPRIGNAQVVVSILGSLGRMKDHSNMPTIMTVWVTIATMHMSRVAEVAWRPFPENIRTGLCFVGYVVYTWVTWV